MFQSLGRLDAINLPKYLFEDESRRRSADDLLMSEDIVEKCAVVLRQRITSTELAESRDSVPTPIVRESSSGYEKLRSLGAGSFGVVHLVRKQTHLGEQLYAMKNFIVHQATGRALQELERELLVAASIDHPHVVRWIETCYVEGQPVLIMEYCDGGDIQKYLKKRSEERRHIGNKQILHWFSQLVLAVAYLHEKQFIHRDIKPSNVFLATHDVIGCIVKLGDFGLTRHVVEGQMTHSLTNCGTMHYMAPELWEEANYSDKVDIWSLGCVLWEMFTLKRAFGNGAIGAIMHAVLHDKPNPSSRPALLRMKHVLNRMLEKCPNDRPSAAQILQDPSVHAYAYYFATIDQREHYFQDLCTGDPLTFNEEGTDEDDSDNISICSISHPTTLPLANAPSVDIEVSKPLLLTHPPPNLNDKRNSARNRRNFMGRFMFQIVPVIVTLLLLIVVGFLVYWVMFAGRNASESGQTTSQSP